MNKSILKLFWQLISNRHVEKSMDKLLVVKIQLMNQYAFLISLLFIVDAIRNLSFGHLVNFIVLAGLGSLLLMLSWFTKIYANIKVAVLALIGTTWCVFYFCSTAGFHNGIAPYYFAILFAALFIFNECNKFYNIFVFLWVFILFYVVQLFDLDWFSEAWGNRVYFHKNTQITLIQSVLLLAVNGYFIMLKNNELQKLYHQALHTIRPNQYAKLSANTASPSVEELVKLARSGDSAFIATFQQVFPEFYANLCRQNSDMTQEELKFCALLKLGFTTKDIATYNHLAIRTVQTRKSRLRKSFCVSPQEDLYLWISQF